MNDSPDPSPEVATLTGSCLCGDVGYEIKGSIKAFYHCHCRRCRKATGTGHASNMMVSLVDHKWTQGEALLQRHNVPGAERFHTIFCRQCGSPMPRISPDRSVSVIPAGSLDVDPPIDPMGRIFQDSRSDWSCAGDDLPTWAQYPPMPGR